MLCSTCWAISGVIALVHNFNLSITIDYCSECFVKMVIKLHSMSCVTVLTHNQNFLYAAHSFKLLTQQHVTTFPVLNIKINMAKYIHCNNTDWWSMPAVSSKWLNNVAYASCMLYAMKIGAFPGIYTLSLTPVTLGFIKLTLGSWYTIMLISQHIVWPCW